MDDSTKQEPQQHPTELMPAPGEIRNEEGTELAPVNRRREAVVQNLNKLRGLLPVLSGALQMVDHGAVQAVARLLPLLGGISQGQTLPRTEAPATPSPGVLDLQSESRDLQLQLMGQTAQIKKLEQQLDRLRENADRDRAGQFALAEQLQSLNKLIKGIGVVLTVLVLVALAGVLFLLLHPRPRT